MQTGSQSGVNSYKWLWTNLRRWILAQLRAQGIHGSSLDQSFFFLRTVKVRVLLPLLFSESQHILYALHFNLHFLQRLNLML